MGWGSARINLDRESQFCKGGLNLTGLHPPFFLLRCMSPVMADIVAKVPNCPLLIFLL
jgi:hypothetical protein